ncbi:MAG: hypothetical protein R3C18_23230 [Planctomycetaceae bacterium]
MLYQAALEFVTEHVENDFADVAHERLVDQPQKPRHGRQETRTYIQFEVPNLGVRENLLERLPVNVVFTTRRTFTDLTRQHATTNLCPQFCFSKQTLKSVAYQ